MLGEIDVALLFTTDPDLIEVRKKFPQVSPRREAPHDSNLVAVTIYADSCLTPVGIPGRVQRGIQKLPEWQLATRSQAVPLSRINQEIAGHSHQYNYGVYGIKGFPGPRRLERLSGWGLNK